MLVIVCFFSAVMPRFLSIIEILVLGSQSQKKRILISIVKCWWRDAEVIPAKVSVLLKTYNSIISATVNHYEYECLVSPPPTSFYYSFFRCFARDLSKN